MEIPGKVAFDELQFLSELAAKVPAGGVIVEVGPLYGRSTFAIGSSAPQAKVYSIDTFEEAAWIDKYASMSKKIPKFGIDAFKSFTGELKNVEAIKGYSPECVIDWVDPIDMYFEDATHGNPNLRENMSFWISHLRAGGIACGHDFTLRFPDVKREVEAWAEKWDTEVAIVGSLWAIRKPLDDEEYNTPLQLKLGSDSEQKYLTVDTRNKRSGYRTSISGYWAGAHLDNDALVSVEIDFADEEPDLQLEYKIANPACDESKWHLAGEKAQLIKDGKLIGIKEFSARLSGNAATEYKVFYRLAFRQIGNGGYKVSGITDWYADGAVCSARVPGADACSITICVAKEIPPSVQNEFPTLGLFSLRRELGHLKSKLNRAVARVAATLR